MKFSELKQIKNNIIKGLNQAGFLEMTPIQEKSIPLAFQGFDIIGQAQTGTGKTAAFMIPILNNLDPYDSEIEHLILLPTRELAKQIFDQFIKIEKSLVTKIALIVGGIPYEKQVKQLKNNLSIIIATPGRLLDYLTNKRIKLKKIKTLVLDEADELLNMGFYEDIKKIIDFLPKERQSFFFTATFNEKIMELAKLIVKKNYRNISISQGLNTSKTIKQEYIEIKEKTKFITLIKLLEFYQPKSTVIFGRTKKRVDELFEAMKKLSYDVISLHGDMKQNDRNFIVQQFRNKKKSILITTDVFARGIDIENIEWIINFDLPQEIENYTHRIGRVGRNGQFGYSLSFVKDDEIEHIKEIEIKTKSKITKLYLPSEDELYKKWRQNLDLKLNKILEKDIEFNSPNYLENDLEKKYTKEELAKILAFLLLEEKNKAKNIKLSLEPSVSLSSFAKKNKIKRTLKNPKKFLKRK